jgi:hypothetical protein
MPRPDIDQPLATYLKGASHVEIRCVSPQHCGRVTTMRTAELAAKAPKARTVREFQNALRCAQCKCKGWAMIDVARRG